MSTAVLIAVATAIAAGVVVAPVWKKWRKSEPLRTSDKFRVAAALAIVVAGVAWGYQAVTRQASPVQRVQRVQQVAPPVKTLQQAQTKGGASNVYVRQVGPTYPPINIPAELMRGGADAPPEVPYEIDSYDMPEMDGGADVLPYEPYVYEGGAALDVPDALTTTPVPIAPLAPAASPPPPSAPADFAPQAGGEIVIDKDTLVLSGFSF